MSELPRRSRYAEILAWFGVEPSEVRMYNEDVAFLRTLLMAGEMVSHSALRLEHGRRYLVEAAIRAYREAMPPDVQALELQVRRGQASKSDFEARIAAWDRSADRVRDDAGRYDGRPARARTDPATAAMADEPRED